ncbi:MAG: hypothetical protein R2695_17650 [Acidimicrobiales bacterium]
MDTVLSMPVQKELQGILFAKIVPNCKKLGLLIAGDGWLRRSSRRSTSSASRTNLRATS